MMPRTHGQCPVCKHYGSDCLCHEPQTIRNAFAEAQKCRPYLFDKAMADAATPEGGEWRCIAEEGAVTRSVVWRGQEVALVNPRGDIDDETEGYIAMAIRAIPTLDAAMRAIIVLAKDAENLGLIKRLAITCIAFVEQPAPRILEPEEPTPYETAARAAGWTHGGDAGGFWFHVETWGSWKAAASWHGTDQEPEDGHPEIYDSARKLCECEGIEIAP